MFLSYASADRARVEKLAAALEKRGVSLWWDGKIAPGSVYARVIEAELAAADVVVVAWSRFAIESDWVRDEAAVGRDSHRLVPLQLDDTDPPLGFRQHQIIRFGKWNGRPDAPEVAQLVDAINATHGSVGATLAGAPRGLMGRRAMLAAGALLVPAAGAGAWWATHWQGSPGRAVSARSIAVLPFENLSGDAKQDYFSDGLSEELISTLASLGSLQVVARTSSFKFRGAKESSQAIGAKLGVAYILDGSVRREGSAVRVSTHLVDAKTGFERWARTFDRDIKNIFAVQSEIAQAVTEALKVRLLGEDIAALKRGGTESGEAYDAYLRGRKLFDVGGGETNYRDALAQFDAAIAADPRFAAAHAGRARALLTLANQYVPPDKLKATFDAALASARRGVELAPGLAEAQATLAGVLASATLDFAAARSAFQRAMVTGSGDADVLTRFGLFSCDAGDFRPGLAAVKRATVLDPLNPRVFRSLGYGLMAARKYAEAIPAMRRALELSPGVAGAHAAIGDALMLQGQLKEARAEYALEPLDWLRQTGQAIVLRKLGDEAGAAGSLKALAGGDGGVSLYQQAQVYAQWGEPERAFSTLAAAYKTGDAGLVLLKTDPMMDPIRKDPRFAAMISRLGLDG